MLEIVDNVATIRDIPGVTPTEVAKRLFNLAYQASVPMGMGWMHERPNVTEEEVWTQVAVDDRGKCSCDYVFGRMVKLSGVQLSPDGLQVLGTDKVPNPEYQSWSTTYRTRELLVKATVASFEAVKPAEPVA